MNLEIGIYCYDKSNRKSGIGKIIEFRKNNNAVIEYKSGVVLISVGNIIASHNLIDLIEVGDFVNGMRIVAKDSDNRLYVAEDLGQYNGCFERTILDEEFKIKTIVAKEQFESMAYNVLK